MKPIALVLVFMIGILTGQLIGAQQPPKLEAAMPAERLTGIGGVFMKAQDPKALGLCIAISSACRVRTARCHRCSCGASVRIRT